MYIYMFSRCKVITWWSHHIFLRQTIQTLSFSAYSSVKMPDGYTLGLISAFVFLPSKAIAVSPSAMYNIYYSHEVPKLLCENATNWKKDLLVLLRLPTARRIPELRTPAGITGW